MAERRMFAKSIVLSDAFLDMPLSARCLYFTLGMLADDDGFVGNPKSIMRQCGASMDDMNVLLSKRYILGFESGVIVIKHWRMNNYLRNDRYHTTTYLDEKRELVIDERGAYTEHNGEYIEEKSGGKETKPLSEARQRRLDAKKESSLPSTFEQTIRNAFVNRPCPICGVIMGYEFNQNRPTIQHNTPISMGGKHEIDNISVICSSCNSSLQNRVETPPYNTDEVRYVWECIGNGSGMDTEVRLGKVRLGNNNIYCREKEPDESENQIVKQVIDYLNEVTGSRYTCKNKTTNSNIKARLSEGHTLEDFKTVIDKKNAQWGKDPKMSKFLRPETLFCSKHFESYLNERITTNDTTRGTRTNGVSDAERDRQVNEILEHLDDDTDDIWD